MILQKMKFDELSKLDANDPVALSEYTYNFNCSDPLRILVAGGAGFIGSHLARRLLKQSHYVICADWKKNKYF
jgi:FlaA1/EpsC-like NDP-sugar epimerase